MKKIKLLVVDDSILFREVLTRYIREDSQIDVVGTAGDPYSARDMILKYEPDVMTLDIEIPRMDGRPPLLFSTCLRDSRSCIPSGSTRTARWRSRKPRTATGCGAVS